MPDVIETDGGDGSDRDLQAPEKKSLQQALDGVVMEGVALAVEDPYFNMLSSTYV